MKGKVFHTESMKNLLLRTPNNPFQLQFDKKSNITPKSPYFLHKTSHKVPYSSLSNRSPQSINLIFPFNLKKGQMGNVCPCPKRNKKKQFAYDVHQQTFQMDENIQNIGEHSPKHDPNHHDNNILTEQLRSSEEGPQNQNQTLAKSIENIHPDSHFQAMSSNKLQSKAQPEQSLPLIEQNSLPLAASTASLQKQPLVQPKSAQPKPSFTANILKPKTIKKKYNPDDYRYLKENGQFKVKPIDSIKEQQYNIDGCSNCCFFIFDITANLYIDDCDHCTIFVAPCQSTIFIRNCKNVTLVAATKQFRTFQCYDCTFSLYCKSQPVIQSSNGLKFTPFKCPVYAQLPKQFSKKRLEPWNNHWSQIHNFTKIQGEQHATFHESIDLPIDWQRAFLMAGLQMLDAKNPVPFIVGELPHEPKNEVLILVKKGVTDEQVIDKLDGAIILKGFQGVVAGEGKEQIRAVLIDALDNIPQKYEELGIVVTNPADVAVGKAKWFVSFSDQREK